MKKHVFPHPDDPAVCYYKGPKKAACVALACLAILFLAVWLALRGRPYSPSFALLLIWVTFGILAVAAIRTKTAATKTCIYHHPAFGAVKAIPVKEVDGYALSHSRYGSQVVLLRGWQRLLSLECTAELINYLNDLGLRAQDESGWRI